MLLLPGSGQGSLSPLPSPRRCPHTCQGASRQVPPAAAKAREKGGTRRRERQHLLLSPLPFSKGCVLEVWR